MFRANKLAPFSVSLKSVSTLKCQNLKFGMALISDREKKGCICESVGKTCLQGFNSVDLGSDFKLADLQNSPLNLDAASEQLLSKHQKKINKNVIYLTLKCMQKAALEVARLAVTNDVP